MPDSRTPLATRLYTARASASGGRNGRVSSDDGKLAVQLAKPGSGEGTNPEQLLAGAWAACLQSTLQGIADRRAIDLGTSVVTAAVSLGQDDSKRWALEAELLVSRAGSAIPDFRGLVAEAHRACPFSRMAAGIPVQIIVEEG